MMRILKRQQCNIVTLITYMRLMEYISNNFNYNYKNSNNNS